MIKHGVPQESILGPLFSLYTNDLPPTISTLSEPIIFCDGISVIISSKKFDDFHTMSDIVLSQMSKCFSADKLALTLDKINIIKFIIKNSPQHALSIGYKNKYIEWTVNTKFLGLQIDNHLNSENHVNQLVPKLSGVCYAVRSMSHINNIETLKSVYFDYFHSVMRYNIIF
jgi:hypothetical protein